MSEVDKVTNEQKRKKLFSIGHIPHTNLQDAKFQSFKKFSRMDHHGCIHFQICSILMQVKDKCRSSSCMIDIDSQGYNM